MERGREGEGSRGGNEEKIKAGCSSLALFTVVFIFILSFFFIFIGSHLLPCRCFIGHTGDP